ncbi:hypothetical protein B7R21_04295 [Subtercola boreus]|uniref:Glycosyl transferase family 1 domain-containing protein n=1 Tax=Subtercola boreus TaxID=120213 RepID=A0A3E0VYX0_9MICO|nr:glycosyltransferase [Subtercola boreus]RFA15252.1 hypothetical protein B7R21_04295 [Subtercola boreus]
MPSTDQASATSPSALSGAHLIAASQVDAWIQGLHAAGDLDGPSAQELQASFSWRVTRPIRAVRARERVALLRQQRRILFPRQARVKSGVDHGRQAFEQRVRAVAPALLPHSSAAELRALPLERVLSELVQQVQGSGSKAELWLLVIAVSGCFPDQQMLFGLARDIVGVSGSSAAQRILNHSAVWTLRYHAQLRTIRLVSTEPVVFTDQTAKFGFNSGIQRVTRQTVSRWAGRERFQLAALTDDGAALRTLSSEESARVLDWQGDDDRHRDDEKAEPDETAAELVVPWQTTVFFPEVPVGRGTDSLAALTRFSPNRTVAIGYDTIPVSSGHLVHRGLSGLFVSYLSTIKYVDEILAISNATASEFIGFSEALATQGLPGFGVETLHLPIEHIPADDGEPPAEASLPVVLSVGSNEPRKNQLAVIFASEILWREGLEFSLVLLGGRGDRLYTDIPDAVAALRDQGRQIELRRDVDEHALAAAYRRARFSVFISLQEGYGLPIAESLAVGTPALATEYGSTAEIAAGGGCVTADPRDDRSIVDGMRALLTDDALLERLHGEIEARDDSTWEAYSADVWKVVSAPASQAGAAQKPTGTQK